MVVNEGVALLTVKASVLDFIAFQIKKYSI